MTPSFELVLVHYFVNGEYVSCEFVKDMAVFLDSEGKKFAILDGQRVPINPHNHCNVYDRVAY